MRRGRSSIMTSPPPRTKSLTCPEHHGTPRPKPIQPLHPEHPTFIFTGTVVARKALRQQAHRFAASELDPRRHPGVWAAMSSTPQPATQIPLSLAIDAPERESKPTSKRPPNPALRVSIIIQHP
jgi:hypothetical protein